MNSGGASSLSKESCSGLRDMIDWTNGVVARSAVARDRSKRMAEASRPRRSPSYDFSDTSELHIFGLRSV
jgi:hypothetical protein